MMTPKSRQCIAALYDHPLCRGLSGRDSLAGHLHARLARYDHSPEPDQRLRVAKCRAAANSNRDLSDENAKLRDQVAELEDQLASAKADAETAVSAQESADNTAKAYELLLQAMDAKNNGDTAACSAALAQLEPLQSYLKDSAAALYAQLAA